MGRSVFKWGKYIEHIYNIRNNTINKENERELQKYDITTSGVFSYSYYKSGLSWKYIKYFKEARFLEVIKDAYINKYNNIMIIYDEVVFDEDLCHLILKYYDQEFVIINPDDINEDCLILNSNVISYIYQLHINTNEFDWITNFKDTINKQFNIYKANKSLCHHKIDYIVSYVNNADVNWQNEYNKYSQDAKETYNQSNRWEAHEDIFKVHIDNVIKYMPWLNKIYLVVSSESQVPEWIDRNRINIILHKDIIPSALLPTFNSCTIEMFLHNINNLSEYFIYANDDTLVLNDISAKTFYNNGNVYNKWQSFSSITNHHTICNNSMKLINNELNMALTNIKFKHLPHAFLLSSTNHVYIQNTSKIFASCTRFRNNKNYNQYLYLYYDLLIGKTQKMDASYKYVKLDNINYNIDELISEYNEYNFICFNDVVVQQYTNTIVYSKSYKHVKTAICAIAKNENKYIREWVEYHKNIGFDAIYLYDNNEVNGEHFEDVIQDYIDSNYVKIINVRGKEKGCVYDKEGINLQSKCYINFYEHQAKQYDWVLFIDIDEFISFKYHITLNNFLTSNLSRYDTILLPWEHYDDNNYLTYTNDTVVSKFTRKSKVQHYHAVKSFVKTGLKIKNKQQINLIHIFTLENSKIICSNGLIPELNKKVIGIKCLNH